MNGAFRAASNRESAAMELAIRLSKKASIACNLAA
jgi:hypothetical protein